MKTSEEVKVDVDLDKPLICEVQWEIANNLVPCGNIATWQGIAHEQTECENGHQTEDIRILLCGRCVQLAVEITYCNNGHDLIYDLRHL